MSLTNKYSRTGVILFAIGFILVALWIVWLDNSNYGKWVDHVWWIGALILIAGVIKIAANSGRNERKGY